MKLFKESLFLVFLHFTYASAGCPQSHPYAYLNGGHCCKTEREGDKPEAGDRPPCDGGKLEFYSRCCEGDMTLPCPNGGASCKTVWDNSLTAALDYPTNERHLCYVNGKLAKILPYGRSSESAVECSESGHLEDQLTEKGDYLLDEYQIFDQGKSEWVTKQANVCFAQEAKVMWCMFAVYYNEEEIASSTGGSSSAKAKRPDTRSCGRYGVGKWKLTNGKPKCVYKA